MRRRNFIRLMIFLSSFSFLRMKSFDDDCYYFYNVEGDNSQSISNALAKYKKVIIPFQQEPTIINKTVVIPSGRVLIVNNNIVQKNVAYDSWSLNNVISNNPVFKINSGCRDISILGSGTINSINEAIVCIGKDEAWVENIKIAISINGVNAIDHYRNKSLFGGISLYKTKKIYIENTSVVAFGNKPIWNGKRVGGGANGLGFYSCSDIHIRNTNSSFNGGSGLFTNNCSRFKISRSFFSNNGLSGIQIGVHPGAHTGYITHNFINNNVADGIDVRWIGDNIISIDLNIENNITHDNGFFYGDKKKPTQDGSGIVTLAGVSNVNVHENNSVGCAGNGIFIQNSNAINIIKNSVSIGTEKEGVMIVGNCSDILISGLDLMSNGIPIVFYSGGVFKNIKIDGNIKSRMGIKPHFYKNAKYTDVLYKKNIIE